MICETVVSSKVVVWTWLLSKMKVTIIGKLESFCKQTSCDLSNKYHIYYQNHLICFFIFIFLRNRALGLGTKSWIFMLHGVPGWVTTVRNVGMTYRSQAEDWNKTPYTEVYFLSLCALLDWHYCFWWNPLTRKKDGVLIKAQELVAMGASGGKGPICSPEW